MDQRNNQDCPKARNQANASRTNAAFVVSKEFLVRKHSLEGRIRGFKSDCRIFEQKIFGTVKRTVDMNRP